MAMFVSPSTQWARQPLSLRETPCHQQACSACVALGLFGYQSTQERPSTAAVHEVGYQLINGL